MAVNPIITSIETKIARVIDDNRTLRAECSDWSANVTNSAPTTASCKNV